MTRETMEALHKSIEEADTAGALSIIKMCTRGEVVNSWDTMREIPLTKAARLGQHVVLQALVDHPFIEVDMLARPKCALYYAVCNGDLQAVNILLTHPGYAPQDWTRICVLALRWGHVRILQTLFTHSAITAEIQSAAKFEAANNKWKIGPQMLTFLENGEVREPVLEAESIVCSESWLAALLRRRGFDETLIQNCERKLVTQEGFITAKLFAALPAVELTFSYLSNIGITAKGLQLELMHLHAELLRADGDICENTATGMSLSVHGIQTYQNIISRVDKLEQVVNGQETRINKLATQLMALKPNFNLVDDNKYDPVCITDS